MASTTELVNEVLAHQFNSARYSSLIVTWLDQAQKRIYRKAKIRSAQDVFEITTEPSVNEYSLPEDYARIDRVIDVDKQDLLQDIEQADFDDAVTSEGRPHSYTIFGSSLYLYPTPNTEYSIRLRYWTLPTTITTSNNPTVPDDYNQLLVEYALHKAYEAEHDFQAAEYHKGNFDVELMNLMSELTEDSREAPTRVSGCW